MTIWKKWIILAKILIEQHSEGIDRRDRGIQRFVILIREIICIQNTKPFSRQGLFQGSKVEMRTRAMIALDNDDGWSLRGSQDPIHGFEDEFIHILDLFTVASDIVFAGMVFNIIVSIRQTERLVMRQGFPIFIKDKRRMRRNNVSIDKVITIQRGDLFQS